MNSKVIVSHPGAQHSRQTALGLQKAGLLDRYLTGFYYKKNSAWARSLQLLPPFIFPQLRKKMELRRSKFLDDHYIDVLWQGELFGALGLSFDKKLRWFDERAAKAVLSRRPRAVICYDTCALQTFRAAKRVGAVCILDQTIGHVSQALRVFAQNKVPLRVPKAEIADSYKEIEAADWILVGSEYVKNSLLEAGAKESKIVLLPYGTDVSRFMPGTSRPDQEFRLLFAGRLNHRKGIQFVYDAFKKCLDIPNLVLWLAGAVWGNTDWMEPYRTQGRLKYWGKLPHEQLANVFHSADVFLYPSLHEGSALVTYEAMASGLAIITTPNSGSVARDNQDGFIVPVGDVDAIVEKIRRLHADAELRKRMGRSARSRAEEFTWDCYHERLAEWIKKVTA